MDKLKKRDGSIVDFNSTKIRNAIMKANIRVAEEPMSEDDYDFLTQKVIKKLEKEGGIPDVEHIQDVVERTLQKSGYASTAKAYILYRAEHAKMREMRDTLPDIFSNLTFAAAKDVDMKRENANINTDTAMGTMLKFGTESAKDYFNKYIIPPHIAKADVEGDIHIHDKDFYTLTETCCQIDLLKLFHGGFSTGHGYLREPNSIRSYAALACIAIQSNQNEMHGGQAVPNFDFAMAEGVRKTYAKSFMKHMAEQIEDKTSTIEGIYEEGKDYQTAILDRIKLAYENVARLPLMADKDRKDFSKEEDRALGDQGLYTQGLDYRKIASRAYRDTVNETHQAMEAVIHNLNSMHCLLPDAKLWVEDTSGEETVAKIMTIKEICDQFEPGRFRVWSINHSTGEIDMRYIYAAQRMDKGRDLVTLTSKSGHSVTCTTNHKIMQIIDGKITEVLPEDATHLIINKTLIQASTTTPDTVTQSEYKDIMASEIIKREYSNSGYEYVYDISVRDNENFMLADGTFVHNSRAGAQVPFSSINYGTDTSPEGRLAIREILNATEEGLGNGETPIFPVQIFKVKEGLNYNPEDPSYDLFKQAMKVSAKRLFPNFSFMDAPFNAQYLGRHPDKPYYDEVGYMGCVTYNTMVDVTIDGEPITADTIGEVWFKLKNDYKKKVRISGPSDYIDLEDMDVRIYDSVAKRYVKVKKWIQNPAPIKWLEIAAVDGKIVVTPDHPLMVANDSGERLRIHAKDIRFRDCLYYVVSKDHVKKSRIVGVSEIDPDRVPNGIFSYDVETESDRFDANGFISHNCRTRVMANVHDPENEITPGRGNLSFTSINLPRIAIESRGGVDENGNFKEPTDLGKFFKILDQRIDLCIEQLLHRFKVQCTKHAYNYPFLMGEGVWIDSEKLNPMDTVEEVLKHGTLSVGFIGLAETLVALTGKHHGESIDSWDLGYKIIKHLREEMDEAAEETELNFSALATPAEGLSGTFVRLDKKKFGIIPGITDRNYYTNSFHVPVYYPISAFDKIKKEAPFHALTNAGHITYVEVDGDIAKNIDAFESIIRCMKESGIGYGSVNHPVDRDPICGYVGIINDVCPRCGRREGEAIPLSMLEELRTKYRNMPDITKYIE